MRRHLIRVTLAAILLVTVGLLARMVWHRPGHLLQRKGL
jgi:hypothetical protein